MATTAISIAQLQADLIGSVITPDDAGYDQARASELSHPVAPPSDGTRTRPNTAI